MALYRFENSSVSGISVVVPISEIDIYDELEYYNNNLNKVKRLHKIIGCHKRRVANRDFVSPSDLAIPAANKLLDDMNIDKKSIDALIYLNQNPDFISPSTAFYIHNRLGLSHECAVFDITHGCVAFVYGLFLASSMIETKQFQRILVVTADLSSCKNLEDRNNAPLFGDAGACALVDCKQSESFYSITTHSSDYEAVIQPYYTFSKIMDKEVKNVNKVIETIQNIYNTELISNNGFDKRALIDPYMDGGKVFEFTMNVVPKDIKKLIEFSAIDKNDLQALCIHQANKQIVKEVAIASGFDGEMASSFSFENYGNNTSCSIASIINSAYFNSIKSSGGLYLLSSFGNGLSSANAIVKFDKNMYLSGICEHDVFPAISRDEYLDYWIKKYSNN